ncbi:MAG: efflux RND transporter periplasmic adaptor subunit, partial [Lachnospiraceae bacterium]|nr:efflux RND transporter periplasmic adaptor subunit [Lachnospiraceae bacterium]
MINKLFVKATSVGMTIVLAAVMFCGCAQADAIMGKTTSENTVSGADAAENTLDVVVQQPDIRNISVSSNFSATVTAESEINVIPLIGGEVVEKNFEVGDHVNEGDLLFKIDDEALQIALNQAEASVTSAQANVKAQAASAEATKAQANATRAQANVSRSSATKTIGEMGYNSQSQDYTVDSAYVSKRSANNSLKSANDSVENAERALDNAKKTRDSAETAMNTAKATYDANQTADNKTAYETAKKAYESAKESVKTYENNLDSAKRSADNAEMNYYLQQENYNLAELHRKNYNTYTVPNTVYSAYATAVGAEASDIGANASDVGAEASVTSSQASLKQAQAGLDSAKLNLEHANVTSPVNGTITAINVTLHNMASQSSAAYTILSDAPSKVVFYVAEETAHNIIPGAEAVINKNGIDYPAQILNIYDTIDATTGLFKVEAVVNSGVDASSLITGSTVSIRTITRRSDNALTVPINSVYYDGEQAFLYADDGGKAKRINVTVGLSDEENVEILEGITGDTKIIVTWSDSLRDGT